MEAPDLLRQIPLFQGLSRFDLLDLSNRLRLVKVAKGDVLFRKGDEGSTLFIIKEGAIKIVLPAADRDEMTVTILSPGDFFGELSLLDQLPRSADAVAVRPSALLQLGREDFLWFLKNSDAAMTNVLATLSSRIRETDRLLVDTCFMSVRARFAKKLAELGRTFGNQTEQGLQIKLKLTQKDLAEMIGTTRESINKELRSLKDAGIVDVAEKSITITDIEKLQQRMR